LHRTCSGHGEKINAFRISVRRPERKRLLGRLRHKRKNNIIVDLKRDRMRLYELDSFDPG
jgi:hypothetical protein